MTKITRREAVAGTAAAALAGGAVYRAVAQSGPSPEVDYALETKVIDMTFPDKVKARVRAYNGVVPGPPLKAAAGGTLRIHLQNSLAPYDSTGWDGDHNVPHDLGTTNLHVHGLDVIPHLFEPLGTGNPFAPMIAIKPGEAKDYRFDIPTDHPPGLYWYHPHHHGSTVVQAVSGMAGPFVITGAIDEVPEIKAAREIFLVVQDIGLYPSNADVEVHDYDPKQNAIWQTFGGNVTIYDPKTGQKVVTPLPGGFTTGDYRLRYFLLNGQAFFREEHNQTNAGNCPSSGFAPQQCPTPTQFTPQRFTMAQGEVVRFRMLNGNSDDMMPIVVEDHDMHLLAMDGRNFPAVRTIAAQPIGNGNGQVLLGPANRAEFLIKAIAKPGIYRIVELAQTQQFLFSAQKVIAEIEITDEHKDMALPTRLPLITRYYPLIKPEEIKRIRTFQFSETFPGVLNPVVGIDFLINNMQYDEFAVPTVVRLDEAEEWHIVVGNTSAGGTEGHPFHIHVNGFEVISIGNQAQPPGLIQDTVWVPQNTTVVIRSKSKQFTGKSVFHCHILPHEDTGMMQNFLIVDGSKLAHR
jgi:suppressor of ftsI